MRRFNVVKGHATMNDFVLVDDPHGLQPLTPEIVVAICDRRRGVGGDGLIRVVRAGGIKQWRGDAGLWFMDYYNADGSIAEMCGNGLRVFARHLVNEQLVDSVDFDVATRAGLKHVRVGGGGLIATQLGKVDVAQDRVSVATNIGECEATAVYVGNPHAVSFISADQLAALDLTSQPSWTPRSRFPEGVNLEFIHVQRPGELRMRVHERGVGETMSCGTGVVAAAAAYRAQSGYEAEIHVQVPGGELWVEFDGDDATLVGPAVVVGRGEIWI
ncbi:MAG: diaminopimelate epimerase [Tessaracoccus sp.]